MPSHAVRSRFDPARGAIMADMLRKVAGSWVPETHEAHRISLTIASQDLWPIQRTFRRMASDNSGLVCLASPWRGQSAASRSTTGAGSSGSSSKPRNGRPRRPWSERGNCWRPTPLHRQCQPCPRRQLHCSGSLPGRHLRRKGSLGTGKPEAPARVVAARPAVSRCARPGRRVEAAGRERAEDGNAA